MAFLVLLLLACLVVGIVALVRAAHLETQLRNHESQIQELKAMLRDKHPVASPAAPPQLTARLSERAAPQVVRQPGPATAPSAPSAPPPRAPSRSREEWEALIGGKLLNRIGSVALIIGVATFLKYAFDRNWVSETVRVLTGGAVGGSLLILASRSHRKGFDVFAQGLVGAGIAILYLSVYAAFNFYGLVSQPAAFVLMSAVTGIAFTQAMRYPSIAVALLGWLGGFVTPFVLATGRDNPVGLFSYLALLDVGLMIVVVRMSSWIVLEPLAIMATWVTYTAWHARHYTPEDLVPAALFLALFWILFHGFGTFEILKGRAEHEPFRRILGVLTALVFFAPMYRIVDATAHQWMGAVTLAFSLLYFCTALLLLRRQPAFEVSIMYFIVTAIALLAIATAIQFTGFTMAAILAVEATALAWAGVHWKKRWVWLAGLALFAVAAVKIVSTSGFFHFPQFEQFTLLLNTRAIALGAFAAGCALGAMFFSKLEHPDAYNARRSLLYGWIVALFFLMTLEVNDSFRKLIFDSFGEQKVALGMYRNMYLAAIWMLYSMPLVFFGLKRQNPPLFLSGIGVISIAIGLGGAWAMSYAPIERFVPFTNVRAALLAFLIIGTLLHTQWLATIRRRYHRLEALLHFTWGLLLFEFCTVETNDYFRKAMEFTSDSVRTGLVFSRFMTLAAVWMVLSLPLVRLGLSRKMRPTLYLGLWTLLLSLGMAAVRGIAFDPIENYTFPLNYRSIIVLLVIAGALAHANWIRYSGQMFGTLYKILNALRIATVILILVLLTAETRDYFQKQIFLSTAAGSQEQAVNVSSLENMKQLCLSGIWLIYSIALMGIGLWKRNRTFRLISIVLFGITILKVFFYDLSFLDTVYRIVSFVGLGVILLAVSYLYQRYKAIIMEPTPEFDDRKGKAHILI